MLGTVDPLEPVELDRGDAATVYRLATSGDPGALRAFVGEAAGRPEGWWVDVVVPAVAREVLAARSEGRCSEVDVTLALSALLLLLRDQRARAPERPASPRLAVLSSLATHRHRHPLEMQLSLELWAVELEAEGWSTLVEPGLGPMQLSGLLAQLDVNALGLWLGVAADAHDGVTETLRRRVSRGGADFWTRPERAAAGVAPALHAR